MAREEEPYPLPSYPGFGMDTEPFATQVTQLCVSTSQSVYARDSYCYIVTLYRKEDSLLHKSIWYLKKKSPNPREILWVLSSKLKSKEMVNNMLVSNYHYYCYYYYYIVYYYYYLFWCMWKTLS